MKRKYRNIIARLFCGVGPGYRFGAVFLVLAAVIITGGWSYYRTDKQDIQTLVEHKLATVADLKVSELTQYRAERLEDGEILDTPAFSQLAQRFLTQPEQATDAQDLLESWLGKYIHFIDYDEVRLLDAQSVTRLSVPAGLATADQCLLDAAAAVLKSGRVTMQDFYQDQTNRHAALAVLVPVRDATAARRPLGVVVLRIDPRRYLYPFIQRWPTVNQTAETLLVRRDGRNVMFLNELRFKQNTALSLHIPLDEKETPAVAAVMGTTGIMEGVDYREVPVIAALRSIPDSPWFMVTKMDMSEIRGSQQKRGGQLIVLVSVLLFGAGACIALIWRQQRVQFYREQATTAQALNMVQNTLQVAMDRSPAGIAIADAPAGTLRYVNDAGLLIRGSDRETIVNGIGINQYVASWHLMDLDGRTLTAEEVPLTRAVMFGETCEREFIIRRDGGDDRLVLARAAPVMDDHDKVVAGVVVFMDITEHKRMEQQLRVTLAEVERSNRDLEQFAYVASHDLQEPLRMVTSYVQLLAQRYEGQLDAKAQKYIHYAVDGALRMQTLINDLLAYSRIGMPGQIWQDTATQAVLDEALRNLDGGIAANQAVIEHDTLPTVPGNATQLVMLFQNLISNAIKFHGAEPPRIQISVQDRDSEWLFAVKDNGIGIEPQHAERVFKIFQRLHTREEYPGTGIGLAICQRVTHHHGGEIWFESTPGHVTTFFFTLSKHHPTHSQANHESHRNPAS